MQRHTFGRFVFLGTMACICMGTAAAAEETTRPGLVDFYGYKNCIKLENQNTRVILCPQAGGRVLEYSWKGQNSLYLAPDQQGWIYSPDKTVIDPCGGRFDVGPEYTLAPHPDLWMGAWSGETIDDRKARLTSVKDPATGLQLIREFTLDEKSSHLICKQTIKNLSDKVVPACHWSRTLAVGGGICLVPLTPPSRFPANYLLYGPGDVMDYRPNDPNIRMRDGFLEITGTPARPKLGIDSYAGWFAYQMKQDLLFVKRFPVYPERIYNEMAAITVSIWYFKDLMCELEPIGPQEKLKPGQSASYTEDWWLLPSAFPKNGASVDLKELTGIVARDAR
ncbi:MAG TPA: hypothetical protein VGP72_13520 [Planctomycetota bacterium]